MFTLQLPPQEFLLECFEYEESSGLLIWKSRPREHFSSDIHFKAWATRFAGKYAHPHKRARRNGRPAYRYVFISFNGTKRKYIAHRIILAMHGLIVPDGMQVDHIDRNPLNNRLSNLRITTPSENALNQGPRHSSPKLGVNKRGNSWLASIRHNGVYRRLGLFSSLDAAIAARTAAEVNLCRKQKEAQP